MHYIVVSKAMPIFRLTPYLRAMRDMGIDEAGMAEIEAEIVANPTHPMVRGLKGARKARMQRSGIGKRGRRSRDLLRGTRDGSFLYDGSIPQK